MKNQLRIELYKAFKNKILLFSVVLGIVFAVMSAISRLRLFYSDLGMTGILAYNQGETKVNPIIQAFTVYSNWIGGESESIGYTLFFNLFPLLAMLPYGWSFCSELNSGYIKNMIPRTKRTPYFLSKLIASFLTGGTAILIPLLFSFLLISLFVPAMKPNVIYDMYFPFVHGSLFSALVYEHPLIFTGIYLCIDFVFAGLFACLPVAMTFFSRNQVAVLVAPFLFVQGCALLRNFLLYISYVEISPIFLLHPIPVMNAVKAPVLLGWFLFFTLISVPVILKRGRSFEIF